MIDVLFSFGTRPEAIKLAPVIHRLKSEPDVFSVHVCFTSQHKQLLRQVTDFFKIECDVDLDVMIENQTLEHVTTSVLNGMRGVLQRIEPDVMLVQGDTTTVFASALAAFYQRVAVGHVEAGLRTFNKFSPFPEEMNRTLATALTDFHFTPTKVATENLMREGVPAHRIHQTGNTVVDALNLCLTRLDGMSERDRKESLLSTTMDASFAERLMKGTGRLILVTAHRRESFGEPFREMCWAMRDIVDAHDDVSIVYPVHPNPNVRTVVHDVLADHPRIALIEPVRYEQLVDLMSRSYVLLTDSGGIQEEGPSLQKPVLVMRDVTERPEGVDAGVARLVGTQRRRIVENVEELLYDSKSYDEMTQQPNPYGDGKASERIAEVLSRAFQ